MVRGAEDLLYTKLAEKFNILLKNSINSGQNLKDNFLPISPIVRNSKDAEDGLFLIEFLADHKETGKILSSQGTAFILGNYGLITCDHVLRYEKPIQTNGKEWDDNGAEPYFDLIPCETKRIVHPSSGQEFNFDIVFRDPVRDLALLKFIGDAPINARHFVPLESAIQRHQKGHLLGFPNWAPGRKIHNDVECVITNKFPRSALNRIEVNVPVRKGNSGGPLVDSLFRVAGVAQLGATQADGNDECLCITEVEKWIKDSLFKSTNSE